MWRAPGKPGSTVTRRVATSTSAMRVGAKVSESKLVPGPRSVATASVRPSGLHAGCRSALRSLVCCVSWLVARSYVYRSVMPSFIPEKAMVRPSGLHAGSSAAPSDGVRSTRSSRRLATS
jgi:hypothetical protein